MRESHQGFTAVFMVRCSAGEKQNKSPGNESFRATNIYRCMNYTLVNMLLKLGTPQGL